MKPPVLNLPLTALSQREMASSSRVKLKASSSAAEVGDSDDVLIEILVRLPAKPVLRFKSVSKKWYSIISTPKFTVTYAKRNPYPLLGFMLHARLNFQPYQRGLFLPRLIYPYDKHPDFLNNPNIKIHHVCNGLMCYSMPHVNAPQVSSFFVCNHSSGQSIWLRVLGNPDREQLKAFNVAFDPLKSPYYRLVFVSELSALDENHRLIKIDTYSSKTKSWRPCKKGLYTLPYDIGFHIAVYWKDAMYWYNQKDQSLAYIDFNDHSVERLRKPRVMVDMNYHYFGESGGHLHLVGTLRHYLFVYEMLEDRSGWVEKYRADFGALATVYPKIVTNKPNQPYVVSVVNLIRGENEREWIFVLVIPECVICYYDPNRALKKLMDVSLLSESNIEQMTFEAHQYIETLASV